MFLLWDVQIQLQAVVQLFCLFDHFKQHFKHSKQDKEIWIDLALPHASCSGFDLLSLPLRNIMVMATVDKQANAVLTEWVQKKIF